jgi:hypothetical protein
LCQRVEEKAIKGVLLELSRFEVGRSEMSTPRLWDCT